jgi:hypothetical protein
MSKVTNVGALSLGFLLIATVRGADAGLLTLRSVFRPATADDDDAIQVVAVADCGSGSVLETLEWSWALPWSTGTPFDPSREVNGGGLPASRAEHPALPVADHDGHMIEDLAPSLEGTWDRHVPIDGRQSVGWPGVFDLLAALQESAPNEQGLVGPTILEVTEVESPRTAGRLDRSPSLGVDNRLSARPGGSPGWFEPWGSTSTADRADAAPKVEQAPGSISDPAQGELGGGGAEPRSSADATLPHDENAQRVGALICEARDRLLKDSIDGPPGHFPLSGDRSDAPDPLVLETIGNSAPLGGNGGELMRLDNAGLGRILVLPPPVFLSEHFLGEASMGPKDVDPWNSDRRDEHRITLPEPGGLALVVLGVGALGAASLWRPNRRTAGRRRLDSA